jgi:hypothetical protein
MIAWHPLESVKNDDVTPVTTGRYPFADQRGHALAMPGHFPVEEAGHFSCTTRGLIIARPG